MHKLLHKPDRVTVHARRLDLARYHLCRPSRCIDPINDHRESLRTDRRTDRRTDLRTRPNPYPNLRNTRHDNLRSNPRNRIRDHLRSYPSNTRNDLHN